MRLRVHHEPPPPVALGDIARGLDPRDVEKLRPRRPTMRPHASSGYAVAAPTRMRLRKAKGIRMD